MTRTLLAQYARLLTNGTLGWLEAEVLGRLRQDGTDGAGIPQR